MNKNNFGFMVILFAAISLGSGCANKDVVKKDDSVAPSASGKAEAARSGSDADAAVPGSPQGGALTAAQQDAVSASRSPSSGADDPAQGPQGGEQTALPDLQQALATLYFDFDASNLTDKAREALAKNFEILKKSDARIRIEGHCDERGSDDYNLALSERRALAAQKYLATLGIPPERLSIIGYGKEKPVDAGHEEAAWAANRRDEFVVVE